jgi:hypothetical protein
MNRHHPDAPARRIELALDLGVLGQGPGEEAREAGHVGAFVGEREVQKLVDAVLGLGSEPGEQARAAVVAHEDAFEQVVGPQEIRLASKVVEHGEGLGVVGGAAAKGLPEKPHATLCQRKELPFGPAEKRRAQRGGQRQVVLGQGEEGQKREKVARREAFAQAQPVRPGHG